MSTQHLGQISKYVDNYNPSLLDAIPRRIGREVIGLGEGSSLPFHGVDLWNLYELSWLNHEGTPQVALGHMRLPCDSINLVESKSLKLYLNGFNQTVFEDSNAVRAAMVQDISKCVESKVTVELMSIQSPTLDLCPYLDAVCIDYLPILKMPLKHDASVLQLGSDKDVEGVWCTHLFRSLCPVTMQPDWASVFFKYCGVDLDWSSVLAYMCGFRSHQAFHEQCVEQIFNDILALSSEAKLSVYACFCRRGGIDINPFRSNFESAPEWHNPLPRQ